MELLLLLFLNSSSKKIYEKSAVKQNKLFFKQSNASTIYGNTRNNLEKKTGKNKCLVFNNADVNKNH